MLIQVCIPTRERGNKEGLPRHSRKDLPRHSRKDLPRHSRKTHPAIPAKHSPPFPQNTPRHSRKTLPVIPAKHSPSFPRRRESIKEQPILNELTRRGLCMHSHAGAWERGKNKAPTSGAVISAHPCCSCYFPGQAILGSQAVPDLRIYPGIGTELLPFNLVKTFCMPIVAIRLISWR